MKRIIKVAAAQLTPIFLDKEKTVDKACEAIAEAAGNGAGLIVFPEVFIAGYPDWVWLLPNSRNTELNELYVSLVENSVSVPGNTTSRICEAARDAGINVVIGMHERNTETSNSSIYNTILFVDDHGNLLGKHRKLVPTGGERLVWARGDGSTLTSYSTTSGKVGGLICWENYMPLARTALYASGVEILASPTWDKSQKWLQSVQHIAREGGVFVISTCMALRIADIPDELGFKSLYPEGREWIDTGNSCIISPNGTILAGPVEAEEKIIYADLDLNEIIAAKRVFDAVGHYSRPDIFEFKIRGRHE